MGEEEMVRPLACILFARAPRRRGVILWFLMAADFLGGAGRSGILGIGAENELPLLAGGQSPCDRAIGYRGWVRCIRTALLVRFGAAGPGPVRSSRAGYLSPHFFEAGQGTVRTEICYRAGHIFLRIKRRDASDRAVSSRLFGGTDGRMGGGIGLWCLVGCTNLYVCKNSAPPLRVVGSSDPGPIPYQPIPIPGSSLFGPSIESRHRALRDASRTSRSVPFRSEGGKSQLRAGTGISGDGFKGPTRPGPSRPPDDVGRPIVGSGAIRSRAGGGGDARAADDGRGWNLLPYDRIGLRIFSEYVVRRARPRPPVPPPSGAYPYRCPPVHVVEVEGEVEGDAADPVAMVASHWERELEFYVFLFAYLCILPYIG